MGGPGVSLLRWKLPKRTPVERAGALRPGGERTRALRRSAQRIRDQVRRRPEALGFMTGVPVAVPWIVWVTM